VPNMSISAKLLLLLGIVAAFVTATVAFSGYQMLRIDARYSSLLMGEAAAATAVAQANRAMQTAHADLADAAASGSDDTSLLDGAIVEFNNAMIALWPQCLQTLRCAIFARVAQGYCR